MVLRNNTADVFMDILGRGKDGHAKAWMLPDELTFLRRIGSPFTKHVPWEPQHADVVEQSAEAEVFEPLFIEPLAFPNDEGKHTDIHCMGKQICIILSHMQHAQQGVILMENIVYETVDRLTSLPGCR